VKYHRCIQQRKVKPIASLNTQKLNSDFKQNQEHFEDYPWPMSRPHLGWTVGVIRVGWAERPDVGAAVGGQEAVCGGPLATGPDAQPHLETGVLTAQNLVLTLRIKARESAHQHNGK
jgi:hypothetical protein